MARVGDGSIKCPKNDSDVKRFLFAVSSHKDAIEYRIRIAGLLAEVQARGARYVTHWSILRHGSVDHLADKRRKLHAEIVGKLVVRSSRCHRGKPNAIILLGPPGAGKTTLGVPLARSHHGVDFTSVNPDDVKEKLPEYDGWNASAVHEESSYVSEMMTKMSVLASRCHMIYDVTGKRADKIAGAIAELNDHGYKVHLVLVDLPPWQAVCRVWERFQRNPFGQIDPAAVGSRYVDPSYVYREVGDRPRKTYTQLKRQPGVAGYCWIDALKSKPGKPVILEQKGW